MTFPRRKLPHVLSLVVLIALLLAAFPTLAPAHADGGEWWREAVFYEIFVRSFADSDGDGVGDINGIIARLDYLNDGDPTTTGDLGVTGIWLMPIMQSPSYHGYDTTDFYAVDDEYGTAEDFRRLIEQAHVRGIRVIIDLVINHTSSQHPWFQDSRTGPDAEYRDWYLWEEENPGTRKVGGDPVWHRDGDAYYYAYFWWAQPDLNFRNPDVTDAVYDVARFWLEEMGVDGFRIDAAQHLIETETALAGTRETHDWLAAFEDYIEGINPEAVIVGEVYNESSLEVVPYIVDDEVDLAFEFALAESIIGSANLRIPSAFQEQIATVLDLYPPGQYATFLTNHDQNRVMSRLIGDEGKARAAAAALFTLPGVPFIYYGEEIGLTGEKPDELIRTPMQWSAGEGAGFTAGTPWQPVNDDYSTRNVEAQTDDPDSLLNHYRQFIHLRAEHVALRLGEMVLLESDCRKLVPFLRVHEDEIALVLLNFDDDPGQACALTVSSDALAPGSYTATDALTGDTAAVLTVDAGGATGYVPLGNIPPQTATVLLLAAE